MCICYLRGLLVPIMWILYSWLCFVTIKLHYIYWILRCFAFIPHGPNLPKSPNVNISKEIQSHSVLLPPILHPSTKFHENKATTNWTNNIASIAEATMQILYQLSVCCHGYLVVKVVVAVVEIVVTKPPLVLHVDVMLELVGLGLLQLRGQTQLQQV